MLKDVTFGQYFPGNSLLHKADARFKVLILIEYIVIVLLANSAYAVGLGLLLTAFLMVFSGVKIRLLLKSVKPLIFVLVFTCLINLFLTRGSGAPLEDWSFIKIYKEGIRNAVAMLIRLLSLVLGTSVLISFTTSPLELTDALESLLSPLKKIKVPVHEFAMMMSIALRFIPILLEETDKIMKAQIARGADFESGNLIKKAKSLVPLLVPLFISAFRRANDLAMAMEARCYRGGDHRTKMKPLRYKKRDALAYVVCASYLAICIAIGKILPGVLGL